MRGASKRSSKRCPLDKVRTRAIGSGISRLDRFGLFLSASYSLGFLSIKPASLSSAEPCSLGGDTSFSLDGFTFLVSLRTSCLILEGGASSGVALGSGFLLMLEDCMVDDWGLSIVIFAGACFVIVPIFEVSGISLMVVWVFVDACVSFIARVCIFYCTC